jgi:fructose-1,6-bisphosphatase II / sedoheptulose-1,7-bisphosphatase
MSSNTLDRSLVLDAVRVTEAAAIASWTMLGRGDEMAADQAAVDAMRNALNELNIDGEIVIGEGERDEAPMLYIGEKVGTGKGPKIDIALDPLEGTTLAAKAQPNALTVMAWAPKGTLLNAPDTYMDKIACGPGLPAGVIDLDKSPADNIKALAEAKGVAPTEITVCVLDRPRHADIIAKVRAGRRPHSSDHGRRCGWRDQHHRPLDRRRPLSGVGRRAGRRAGLRGAEVRRRPVPGPAAVPQRRRARARRQVGHHRAGQEVRPARNRP